MEMLKDAILQALEDRYNAQISEAEATLKIYLEKPVAIGEHPQHVDEADKLIEKIANAEEKLEVLKEFKDD
jgi:uncharacterized protein (DUF342 family)